jgi:hypothetical protein
MDKGYALWTYGLVSLEFQDERLSTIKELKKDFSVAICSLRGKNGPG